MTVQTGLVTALCAIIDLIAFLATVSVSIHEDTTIHSRAPVAHWNTSHFQSPPLQALHEFSHVKLEFAGWMGLQLERSPSNARLK